MDDGEAFIPVARCVLERLRSAFYAPSPAEYDDHIERLHGLTVGFLYTFNVVCNSRGRKDAQAELQKSASVISRTCSAVEKAAGIGSLFSSRSSINLTAQGRKVQAAVGRVVKLLADFEGEIDIKLVKKPTEFEEMLATFALIQHKIPGQIAYLKNELLMLERSKKGKIVIDAKRKVFLSRIEHFEQMNIAINSSNNLMSIS